MATRLFQIKLDPAQVEGLAQRLSEIDVDVLAERMVEVTNKVARDTYDLARKDVTKKVNLSDNYVRDKLDVEEASRKDPRASIVAVAKNSWMTNLSHYGSVIEPQPVKDFPRAKGDPGRGLPRGQKMLRMNAEVIRGQRKSIGKKFTIPGIQDSQGNPIVFRGTGSPGQPRNPQDKGRRKTPRQGVEAVLGPSVYQLFRVAAENIFEEVSDNLESAVVAAAEQELLKAVR